MKHTVFGMFLSTAAGKNKSNVHVPFGGAISDTKMCIFVMC